MKYLLAIIFFLLVIRHGHAQSATLISILNNLQQGDTLYLNFGISHSEFGSAHEGLLIYKNNNKFLGKHVLYNYGISLSSNKVIKTKPNVTPIALQSDSLLNFYNQYKENYFTLKQQWELSPAQVQYLNKYLCELEKFEVKGFSNAPDSYTVLIRERSLVILDPAGDWNKFVEVKKVMRL